jgi:hypothetical protein
MSPQQAHLLVGHSPDIVEELRDWAHDERCKRLVPGLPEDLETASAEIDRLRCALRAVRACTDPAWAAQIIRDALREGEGT